MFKIQIWDVLTHMANNIARSISMFFILRLLFPCGSSNLGLGIHQCFKRTVLAKVGNAMHHSMRTHFQELRILPSYLGYAVWSRPIIGSLLDLLDLLRMWAEAASSKWLQSSSMWELRSCRLLWWDVKMYEAMHCKICKCLKINFDKWPTRHTKHHHHVSVHLVFRLWATCFSCTLP